MKTSQPSSAFTLVGTIQAHEAGHVVASLACGGGTSFAWATDIEGRAASRGATPLGEMIVLAAGCSAQAVICPFKVPLSNAPVVAPLDVEIYGTREVMRLEWPAVTKMVENTRGVKNDREMFDTMIEKLAADGRIKRRENWESRWWWWCRRKATRLIESHRAETKAIAKALQQVGVLMAADIEKILAGTPLARIAFSGSAGGESRVAPPAPLKTEGVA